MYRCYFQYFQHLIVFCQILPIFLFVYACICSCKLGRVIFRSTDIYCSPVTCARNFLSLWVKVNKTAMALAFAEIAVTLTLD